VGFSLDNTCCAVEKIIDAETARQRKPDELGLIGASLEHFTAQPPSPLS
jgi:hypothetical protein